MASTVALGGACSTLTAGLHSSHRRPPPKRAAGPLRAQQQQHSGIRHTNALPREQHSDECTAELPTSLTAGDQQRPPAAQGPRRAAAEQHAVGEALPAMAAVAAAVAAVPALLPQAASASGVLATLVGDSLQQHHASDTLVVGCVCLGAASLLTTLVCTSRFLVSYFPPLEREVESRRWHVPWVAVTLFDPLLQPVRRGFFGQKEEGDLDYAAVALLAIICSLLECLVGKDGVLNDSIPDFAVLQALQWLILYMHGMLLPCWCLVVLAWGRIRLF